MLAFLFDADRRVLLVRWTGTVDESDLVRHRALHERFVAREGEMPTILDLSGIERVALPTNRIRNAGQSGGSLVGRSRAVVALPGSEAFGLARMFITTRDDSGHATPQLVRSLDEALRLLGVAEAQFIEWSSE